MVVDRLSIDEAGRLEVSERLSCYQWGTEQTDENCDDGSNILRTQ
jgi:hypothetical protein